MNHAQPTTDARYLRPAHRLATLAMILAALALGAPAFAQDAPPAPPDEGSITAPPPDPDASAPTEGEPATPSEANEGDLRLFGEEFQLSAVTIEIELAQNEVTKLDAQQDVILEMDRFTINCVRLDYAAANKTLRAYGDETQRCIVNQEDAISRCDTFVYNTETGRTDFFGNPEIEFKAEQDADSNLMRANDIKVEQNKESNRTIIRLRNNAVLGSRSMIDRQLDNPKTTNPSIVVGGEPREERKLPGVVIDDQITTHAVRIDERNAAQVTDATQQDLKKIKPSGELKSSKGKDVRTATPKKPAPTPRPADRPL